MELIKTVQELQKTTMVLRESNKKIKNLAIKKAETERVYRMELSKEKYRLRESGMPITLIEDIAKGNVADIKYERDLAAELHRSALQSLESLKVEVQAWQSILRNLDEV